MYMRAFLLVALSGCNMLEPRVADQTIDAPARPPDAPVDAFTAGMVYVLPAGTVVPPASDDPELTSQIRIFDGLSDSALAMNGGVLVRSTGKAGGASVRYWTFSAGRGIVDNYVASTPLYILADSDGSGGYTPHAGHPWLIDSVPGDPGYTAIRRLVYVPVTAKYAGELLTSTAALAEAIELGLVGEPVPAGTWRNMPVVAAGTKLEVSSTLPAVPATEVYAKGHRVELFPLGGSLGIQPLRNGQPLGGQEERLLSGVATGTPPALPVTLDATPVFQYGIPAAPPTTTPNYTPIVTEVDVRLANGVDPTTVLGDAQLFRRATNGSISAYLTDTVASYTVMTTVSNKQIQFVDGEP